MQISWHPAAFSRGRYPEEKLFLGSSMHVINSTLSSVMRVFSTSLHFRNELPNPDHFPHREVIKSVTLITVGGCLVPIKMSSLLLPHRPLQLFVKSLWLEKPSGDNFTFLSYLGVNLGSFWRSTRLISLFRAQH